MGFEFREYERGVACLNMIPPKVSVSLSYYNNIEFVNIDGLLKDSDKIVTARITSSERGKIYCDVHTEREGDRSRWSNLRCYIGDERYPDEFVEIAYIISSEVVDFRVTHASTKDGSKGRMEVI